MGEKTEAKALLLILDIYFKVTDLFFWAKYYNNQRYYISYFIKPRSDWEDFQVTLGIFLIKYAVSLMCWKFFPKYCISYILVKWHTWLDSISYNG